MKVRGGLAGAACIVAGLFGAETAGAQSSVPASIAGGWQVLTKVTVNNEPAWMRVDTGATRTVIDSRAARALELPAAGEPVTTQTLGCKTQSQPVTVSTWTLGKLPLPRTSILAVRQRGKLERYKGLPVLGLLGNDVLAGFGVVGVDFADRRLILGGPFPATGRPLASELLRDKETGAPALFAAEFTVRGEDLVFAVDTGASLSVIDGARAREMKLKRAREPVKVRTVSCAAKARPVLLPGLRTRRVRLPGGVALSNRGLRSTLGVDGLIGVPELSAFGQVTFDYATGRISFGFPLPAGTTPAGLPG